MIINYCSSRKKFVSHGERYKEAWDPKGEATKLVGNQNGGPNFVESNIFCWVLFKFLAVFRRNWKLRKTEHTRFEDRKGKKQETWTFDG